MTKHPIVHIELSAKDLKVSGKFYADVFGWKIEHLPEMNYATFETGEGIAGGLNPITESNPPGTIVVYIGTDDIEASLAKIEAAGGTAVFHKAEIPGFGWFGLFKDPSGNMVGLYTAMAGQA